MKKERIEGIKIQIPESKAEADRIIKEIGEFQVEEEKIEQETNAEIKTIRGRTNRRIVPKQRAKKSRFIGLYVFYATNQHELTDEGRTRLVNLVYGQFGIQKNPPAVNIRNRNKVLKALKARNLRYFIRIIEEIDKEAILTSPHMVSGVPGIKISQKERFVVRAKETDTEVSEDVKKLRKFLA